MKTIMPDIKLDQSSDGLTAMREVVQSGLPGFYVDARGVYGIVIGGAYIGCFINDDDLLDVTADKMSANGDFTLNFFWETYRTAKEAIAALRKLSLECCKQFYTGAAKNNLY